MTNIRVSFATCASGHKGVSALRCSRESCAASERHRMKEKPCVAGQETPPLLFSVLLHLRSLTPSFLPSFPFLCFTPFLFHFHFLRLLFHSSASVHLVASSLSCIHSFYDPLHFRFFLLFLYFFTPFIFVLHTLTSLSSSCFFLIPFYFFVFPYFRSLPFYSFSPFLRISTPLFSL